MKQRGFTLVEILVAIAIFVITILAIAGTMRLTLRASVRAAEKTQAAFLLEGGAETVRYLRDKSWIDEMRDLTTSYDVCLRYDDSAGVGNETYVTTQENNVLLLHMDETTGSPVDSSGREHVPVVGGSMGYGVTAPMTSMNTGYSFDGSSTYVNIPASSDFNFDSFTFSVWVKTDDTSGNKAILTSLSAQPIFLTFANGDLSFSTPFEGSALLFPVGSQSPSLDNDEWRHIVAMRDVGGSNTTLKLYIDGNLVASKVDSGTDSFTISDKYVLGALHFGLYTWFFSGEMDEVSFYNRALTDDEVMALATSNHPVCGLVDNEFSRTVRFKNVCRATNSPPSGFLEDDVVGPVDGDQTSDCTNEYGSGAADQDPDMRHATISVWWGDNFDLVETIELYVGNLFLESEL